MSLNIWMLCFLCFGDLSVTFCLCPSQCICTFQNYSGEHMTRTVLCNDPEMILFPNNIPAETVKLVIEKTLIQQIPIQAFSSISSLEYIWLSSNSISSFDRESLQSVIGLKELRLDRNALATFPWEALSYLPQLWLLDLHDNVLQSFPSQAATYLRNITYLDLSGNQLTTLSIKVISIWLTAPKVCRATSSTDNSKRIIGLHGNPWKCDCRLSELVHLVKRNGLTTALMDPGLKCTWPENLSESQLSSIDLKKCQSPTIHAVESKVTTVMGRIVSLYCVATGVPIPDISWLRLDNILLNDTVIQDNSHERLKWSALSLSTASHQDSGIYLCRASNLVGTSNASISLLVVNSAIELAPIKTTPKRKMRKLMAKYVTALTTTVSPRESSGISHAINGTDYFLMPNHQVKPNEDASEIVSQVMDPPQVSGLLEKRRSADDFSDNITSSPSSTQPEADCLVRTVRVIGGTYHSVSLAWRSPKATNITIFSILYTTFGEREMRRINVGPGKTKITIGGLMPQTKYIVCICLKGLIPKKEQCVIFSTDEVANASGTQKLINLVVITVACVIVVPLTLIVCCGALKRRCRKFLIKPPEEGFQNDSYVTFESLSTGPKPSGAEGEYQTRHNKDESNRLLSPRSSLDSEEATNSEVQQHEYFC
ncbi:leucine-rich repeat, immunoglobulin-like domain and transmembrane domain-containing protein 1a [Hemiscyllium ocellatum]|uniref:leucine-rich repeat, immunoglobulin-like domain and transmembrane domain-containing protein 1a n=1 Tax=Hemiscyllium ocellatum TaxID=170820 RepID=UPI002966D77F|nr:leucine-rich repeat, immunoglobulin-like domain and transmembrane domain-containing protein 1a [Hemiscyllium ocellatum]